MLTQVARTRGPQPGARRWSVHEGGKAMLIVVSAAYIGVMAAVFTRGVQQAAKTHRQAHRD